MWKIDKKFTDLSQPQNLGYLKLNPDFEKTLKNQNVAVNWTGILNDEKIKIRLHGDIYTDKKSYDFIDFPTIFSDLEQKIMNYISEYYKYLD